MNTKIVSIAALVAAFGAIAAPALAKELRSYGLKRAFVRTS
jgi:hypothetical protein